MKIERRTRNVFSLKKGRESVPSQRDKESLAHLPARRLLMLPAVFLGEPLPRISSPTIRGEGSKLTRTYKLADILAGRLQLSHVEGLNLTREDSVLAAFLRSVARNQPWFSSRIHH